MPSQDIIWPDSAMPPGVKEWVVGFLAAADSREEGFARRFADFFHDEGKIIGMAGPIHGRKGRI